MRQRNVLRFKNAGEQILEVVKEQLPKPGHDEKRGKLMQVVSFASELGFSISLPIVGGAFLGQFLDSKLGTAPKMTLSLIFVGVFIGATNIYFIIRDIKEK